MAMDVDSNPAKDMQDQYWKDRDETEKQNRKDQRDQTQDWLDQLGQDEARQKKKF